MGFEYDLFDCDREPADQPRHLVQLLGIPVLNGAGKPNKAFVIAHRGYVAGNDRRHRPYEIGLDVWHRITSGGIRLQQTSLRNKSFSGSVRGAEA
jgi:hypothetical protein